MQRWTALGYAIVLVIAVGLVIALGGKKGQGQATISLDGGIDAADSVAVPEAIEDGGDEVGDGGVGGGSPSTDAGATLLSGQAPPGLSADAPKRVRFGVVLVQYKGAQGAGPTARSREAALELAQQLAQEAQRDFKAAVDKGDSGSSEDLGYLPRGILEPAPEYELFSLPKGGVGGPVDTPRGFWIVRRIE